MVEKTIAHYQILDELGAGGMGVVYRARDTRLDREAAIKALPEDLAEDSERLARFEREAKLLASLNNPHIATVYGLEEVGGRRFLAMELVEGQSLAERLDKGPIPVKQALGLARQIAEGLEAAHKAGVIHRDVKPGNIMIDNEGKAKVLDFGLAKALRTDVGEADSSLSPTLTQPMTQAGRILGTPVYMSPEQAEGKEASRQSDIWAFGCVLYEILTPKRSPTGARYRRGLRCRSGP
jgi:serine/threonine protein kinase